LLSKFLNCEDQNERFFFVLRFGQHKFEFVCFVGTSILIFQLCIREGLAMGLFGFEIVKVNKLKEVENLKGPHS